MLRLLLLLVGGLLLALPALPAFATDGDPCDTTLDWTPIPKGVWRPIWCVYLCVAKTAASGSCSDFNFATAGSPPGSIGLSDLVSFEIGSQTDCTAGTITLTTAQVTGGVSHYIGDTAADSQLDLTGVAHTRIINAVNNGAALDAIIQADYAGVSGCSEGFDVLMIGYEETRQ